MGGGPYLGADPGYFGPFAAPDESQVQRGPGKTIARQDTGSPVGRRGAGSATITGGDPVAHTLNHYGKNGLQGLLAQAPGPSGKLQGPSGTSGGSSGGSGGSEPPPMAVSRGNYRPGRSWKLGKF